MTRFRVNIFLLTLALAYLSCNRMILRDYLTVQPTDRISDGNDVGRTNTVGDTVIPPLNTAWDYDAMAGFSSTAGAITDSVLFVGNLQGEVYAIHIRTGKGLGKYDLGSSIVGAPAVDNRWLYVALTRNEENLIAYDLQNGIIRWRLKIGDIESSPLLIENRIYVSTLNGKVICVEKETGAVVWTYEVPQRNQPKSIRSSPASDGNIVVFGCDDGNVYAIGIKTGTLLWQASTGGSITASPSIEHGKVFINSLDGTLYSFDAHTGKQIWKRQLGSRIYSSQAVGQNKVYIGTAGGFVYCLGEETGLIVWQARTSSVVNATPVLSGNVLYVGCTDKTLYAFDATTGNILWQYKTEGRIKTTPVIAKHYVFLFVEDHSVIALREEGTK
jgi:eukaryotic-like serine/threonine-protein kinase